mgnify:CR=1 FL=1
MKAFCYTWAARLAIIAIVSALSTLPVKADLHEGLIGLWLFDDGADDKIEDSSGNKNHGVLDNGAKAGQAGKFGDAVVTQPQKAVSVPITDSLNSLEKAMSLGGWFRIDEPSDTGHRRNASYLLEDQASGEQNPDGWVFAVWTDAGVLVWHGARKRSNQVSGLISLEFMIVKKYTCISTESWT